MLVVVEVLIMDQVEGELLVEMVDLVGVEMVDMVLMPQFLALLAEFLELLVLVVEVVVDLGPDQFHNKVVLVVPVSSSSPTLHKYLKNHNGISW
jgi:hypothetical protein